MLLRTFSGFLYSFGRYACARSYKKTWSYFRCGVSSGVSKENQGTQGKNCLSRVYSSSTSSTAGLWRIFTRRGGFGGHKRFNSFYGLHEHLSEMAMAQEKPRALISEEGEESGYTEEAINFMKQHFQLITHQELLQNPSLVSSKIQVLFVMNNKPAPEPSLLSLLPALKIVVNGGVGIDHLDVPYLNSIDVRVSNTPHVVSNATADMALALLLASARGIVEGHQLSVDPKTTYFPHSARGFEVTGSTLGIIGMGHIGYKIAQRGRGFDMKILYHNRSRRASEDEQAVGATYCKNMDELLRESDFVVLAVNLTPQTTGLISHRELSLMKPTATLVNISRGLVVDQDALVQALQTRTIRAAALDVTYPETLPRDHPLLHLPNIIITPHTGTDTTATIVKMVQMMVDNALAAIQGVQIPNEVKPM